MMLGHELEAELFSAIQILDLEKLSQKNLSPVLPYLAKLLRNPSFLKRQDLIKLLYPIKKMNDINKLLSVNIGDVQDSKEILSTIEFESCEGTEKLQLALSSYMEIYSEVRQQDLTRNKLLRSELFDNSIYHTEVSYCLCALLYKSSSTSIINILDVCETLIHIKSGPLHICRLIANMPDKCLDVCLSLINFGDRQDDDASNDEIAEQRAQTIRLICRMNPSISLLVRSESIRMCKKPSLVFMLTIDYCLDALTKYKESEEELLDTSGSTIGMEISDSFADVSQSSQSSNKLRDSFDGAIAFITGILLGSDENTRSWFAHYIKASQKRIDQGHETILGEFRTLIQNFVQEHLLSNFIPNTSTNNLDSCYDNELTNMYKLNENSSLANQVIIRATAVLRMYCALRGIGSIKLNEIEYSNLLRLITVRLPANQTSINFAIHGLCSLLACSSMSINQKDAKMASEWLKWIIRSSNYNTHKFSLYGRCSISELLLLIAIHFLNNQNIRISELICTTLDMKIQIKASISAYKMLFVQDVFNDQMIAEHAAKVPVTKGLNNKIEEFLPVHCIHQLLENRSFNKHQVPIKDWVFKQICESILPMHNILPRLIEAFVLFVTVNQLNNDAMYDQKFSMEEINFIFKVELYLRDKNQDYIYKSNNRLKDTSDDCRVSCYATSQVLMLYYLLLYEDIRLKKNFSATEVNPIIKYSLNSMMDIPIYFLLQLVHEDQNSFGPILPGLMKLFTSQYPQLCLVQHWLRPGNVSLLTDFQSSEQLYNAASLKKRKYNQGDNLQRSRKLNSDSIISAYQSLDSNPLLLIKVLCQILTCRRFEIWQYASPFVSNMGKLLDSLSKENEHTLKLLALSSKIWWKMNSVFPRKLWVLTVNALRVRGGDKDLLQPYEWMDLVSDPLIVLRCDRRVFRNSHMLDICLHVLNAFLAASKRCLVDQIGENQGGRGDYRGREELCVALIAAQTSASIQILLESCLPNEEEMLILEHKSRKKEITLIKNEYIIDRYESCVDIICENLHQSFIADTNLAKLVHFQTYPSDLLSKTTEKIPSMHICLDFIPELLSQPDLSKQIFVVELTSYLCEKYAITKSLSVAKLCFNASFTLLQVLPSERRAIFFIPVLPALLRVCKVFPILLEDMHIIIKQLKQITTAHVASTTSRFSMGSSKPCEGLEKIDWMELKKISSSLNLQEALYLVVQKSLIECGYS